MTIKAMKGVPVDNVSRETSPNRMRETLDGLDKAASNPDELVMVLFPKVAYDEFVRLTEEAGAGSVAETISVALKLLRETLNKSKAEPRT